VAVHDEGEDPEHHALKRGPSDHGSEPAGAEQEQVEEKDEDEERIKARCHRFT
jgi:hypothetical protein